MPASLKVEQQFEHSARYDTMRPSDNKPISVMTQSEWMEPNRLTADERRWTRMGSKEQTETVARCPRLNAKDFDSDSSDGIQHQQQRRQIHMMTVNDTVLALVDVQGKLAELMHEKDLLFDNLRKLVRGVQILKIPIIWMEQIPEKMGKTIPVLQGLLASESPISKTSFSCCAEQAFLNKLEATGRKQVLIAGIETHVCVFQTAADLVQRGYHVEIVADAVSSRTLSNKLIGLERAKAHGAFLTSVESSLFELLRTAAAPEFKEILKLVR
jgi:nicotinamidase-related amidase